MLLCCQEPLFTYDSNSMHVCVVVYASVMGCCMSTQHCKSKLVDHWSETQSKWSRHVVLALPGLEVLWLDAAPSFPHLHQPAKPQGLQGAARQAPLITLSCRDVIIDRNPRPAHLGLHIHAASSGVHSQDLCKLAISNVGKWQMVCTETTCKLEEDVCSTTAVHGH